MDLTQSKGALRSARKAAAKAGRPLDGDLAVRCIAPVVMPKRRRRRVREDWADTWARRYDSLNGAPENDGDR